MPSVATLMVSNIPANAVRDVLRDADTGESDLRFLPGPGMLTLAIVASAVGIELTIKVGDYTAVERSTLEAGGTTGVFPNMDQKAAQYEVPGGILRILVRETAGVATTDVMAAISFDAYA